MYIYELEKEKVLEVGVVAYRELLHVSIRFCRIFCMLRNLVLQVQPERLQGRMQQLKPRQLLL